jgi:hypothetical protein
MVHSLSGALGEDKYWCWSSPVIFTINTTCIAWCVLSLELSILSVVVTWFVIGPVLISAVCWVCYPIMFSLL